MKTNTFFLLLTLLMLTGCTQLPSEQEIIRTDAILIIDRTDPLALYPDALTVWAALQLREHPWQAVQLTITTTGDTDINPDTVLVLPGNTGQGSKRKRKQQLERFYTDLQHTLERFRPDTSGMKKSIIFRSLVRHLNTLSESTAERKALWVWSDLLEHSNVSFYSANTLSLLTRKPQQVISQLEAGTPLRNCPGCQVSFIYRPSNYADNLRYMTIVQFYTDYFSSRGITVLTGEQPKLP